MKIFLICITFSALVLTATVLTANQTRQPLPAMKNPHLIIEKKKRLLRVYDGEKFVREYQMVLGFAAKGDKEIEGDGKTPEGEFYVFTKNDQSRFHVSLGLSYPNIEAATRGRRENLISQAEHDQIVEAIGEKKMPPQKTALGGEIYIHGGGTADDWTFGCVALRNEEMKEIFDAIPVGASVRILPEK